MKNEPSYPYSCWRVGDISTAFSVLALIFVVLPFPSHAQSAGNNDLSKQREIHNTFSSNQKNGSILDATNPMDLINRLRQATSMDNATSPSDAIDEALKLLDEQDIENASSEITNPVQKSSLQRSLKQKETALDQL